MHWITISLKGKEIIKFENFLRDIRRAMFRSQAFTRPRAKIKSAISNGVEKGESLLLVRSIKNNKSWRSIEMTRRFFVS